MHTLYQHRIYEFHETIYISVQLQTITIQFVASLETDGMVVDDEQDQAGTIIKHGKSQKPFFTSFVDETRDTGSEKKLDPHKKDMGITEKADCQNQGGNQSTQHVQTLLNKYAMKMYQN